MALYTVESGPAKGFTIEGGIGRNAQHGMGITGKFIDGPNKGKVAFCGVNLDRPQLAMMIADQDEKAKTAKAQAAKIASASAFNWNGDLKN